MSETKKNCSCGGGNGENLPASWPCLSSPDMPTLFTPIMMLLTMMLTMAGRCGCNGNGGDGNGGDGNGGDGNGGDGNGGDGNGGDGSDGTGIYPLGAVAYFPYVSEAPSSKWVLCDGLSYRPGTYPQIDTLYAAKNVLYHIDRELTSNTSANDLAVLSSNSSAATYKLFQDSETFDPADCWTSATTAISEQTPQWVGLEFKTKTPKFLGIELMARYSDDVDIRRFPSKVRLLISDDGGTTKKSLTGNDIIELQDPGKGGVVRIKLDVAPTPASRFYLEIYGVHGSATNQFTALARMHVFAQENNFIAPIISENIDTPTVGEVKGIWCIRVAE